MRSLADSLYHKSLCIFSLTLALLLLFVSGLLIGTTAELTHTSMNQLANAIGSSAYTFPAKSSVSPGSTSWQRELTTREVLLTADAQAGRSARDWNTFVLATLLFISLLLIVLNYALEYVRRQPVSDTAITN